MKGFWKTVFYVSLVILIILFVGKQLLQPYSVFKLNYMALKWLHCVDWNKSVQIFLWNLSSWLYAKWIRFDFSKRPLDSLFAIVDMISIKMCHIRLVVNKVAWLSHDATWFQFLMEQCHAHTNIIHSPCNSCIPLETKMATEYSFYAKTHNIPARPFSGGYNYEYIIVECSNSFWLPAQYY